MKKHLAAIIAVIVICNSCSKDHFVKPPAKNTFKISVTPVVNSTLNDSWQQVIGGKANLEFTPVNNDSLTLSSVIDSLDLGSIGTYNKQVMGGAYDISLHTQSKAVADTFIRFDASAKNVAISKDQTISLDATTSDGVITIKKTLINSSTLPTFVADSSTTVQNFGLANGYYFIYVKGAASGKVVFTETTTGFDYVKEITVDALNQYDLSPILGPDHTVKVKTFTLRSKNTQIQ